MKNINFITKLKTEPKFRKNVIAVTATALVLVICAVSIPVGLHVRKSDVQKTAENITASVTEATTLTVDAKEISTTEPTTLTAVVSETAAVSASPTQKQNNKTGTGDNGSPSSSSNKTGNSSKPTATKAPSTTKKAPETSTNTGTYNWTRAQADAFIAKARAYGESIGLIWDDSFSIEAQNASWNASVWTSKSKTETRMIEQMKEQLNDHKYGQKKATYFKIQAEYNEPTSGNWEFTILYM